MKFENLTKYLLIIFFLLFANKAYSENSIVYLDLDYILKKSVAGSSIVAQLNNLNKKNLEKLKKKEIYLKKEEDKLNSQKNILSKEELNKKILVLRKEIEDYKKLRKSMSITSNQKMIKAQTDLINKLTPILAKYSEEKNISMIVQKKNIIIGKSDLDITKDILDIANNGIKKININ